MPVTGRADRALRSEVSGPLIGGANGCTTDRGMVAMWRGCRRYTFANQGLVTTTGAASGVSTARVVWGMSVTMDYLDKGVR